MGVKMTNTTLIKKESNTMTMNERENLLGDNATYHLNHT